MHETFIQRMAPTILSDPFQLNKTSTNHPQPSSFLVSHFKLSLELKIIKFYSDAGHAQDLGSISVFDSPEMRASKERGFELIREWLRN